MHLINSTFTQKIGICALVFGLLLSAMVVSAETAAADNLVMSEVQNVIDDRGVINYTGDESIVELINRLFFSNLLVMFKYVFGFVAILLWTVYVIGMIGAAGNADSLSTAKKNLVYGVVGFVLISLAVEIGEALNPVANPQTIVEVPAATNLLRRIAVLIQVGIGLVALGVIFFAGLNLIRAQGEEDQITRSKQYLVGAVLGMVVAILAGPMIDVFFPEERRLENEQISDFATQFTGFIQFLLNFLAVGAFLTLIIAGLYYITSFGEDERQEQAKNIIFGTLLGIVVILSAFAIITVFVPQ
jgi:hypothetical protein